nr:hypothetical protein [Tanacetum cinerariifolium]
MLEFEAYMTYRAYATGEKTPKPNLQKRRLNLNHLQRRILLKLLKEKESRLQLREINLSKKEFYSSHASGSGDGVNIHSNVPDQRVNRNLRHSVKERTMKTMMSMAVKMIMTSMTVQMTIMIEDDDQENVSGETKLYDDEDDFVHPNLSTYNANDQEEEDEEEKANDDDEVSSDQKVSTPPNYETPNEEDNQEDDDKVMGGEQEDEELYEDLNLNLDRRDADMTDTQINQENHLTLTTELPVVQQQSSCVSSDLVSKFINPTFDTCIDSILNPNVQYDIPVNVSVSVTTETPSSDYNSSTTHCNHSTSTTNT